MQCVEVYLTPKKSSLTNGNIRIFESFESYDCSGYFHCGGLELKKVILTCCCSFSRNNLTVLDVVSVQGQGARGELMINGKRPSGDSVLLFELKQKHLEDCTSMYFIISIDVEGCKTFM